MRILFLILVLGTLTGCALLQCDHDIPHEGIELPDYQPEQEKQFYDEEIDNPYYWEEYDLA